MIFGSDPDPDPDPDPDAMRCDATVVEQASSLLVKRNEVSSAMGKVTFSAGLLTRIRLDGGSESASPDQHGQRKGPEEQ